LERGCGDEENTGKYLSEGNSALRHNIHTAKTLRGMAVIILNKIQCKKMFLD